MRPEGQAHADLFCSPGDDERHHAIESDGRQKRRQRAKARRHHRDQPFGEQYLIELRIERPHLGRRHARIQLFHGVVDRAEHLF